jgi:3,4-dihydroxy 2-butanone 4-phosphate synthase/GTP cyclohydrolase II
MTQTLKNRLTDLVESGRMTRAGLARAAGLHANTLRNLGAADWNPSAETLDKLEAYLASDGGSVMATAEEIINEALNGRMFILVDDEDRENEGDLVIPAQMATPDAINFMATHGRGLICLSMTKKRVDELGLDLMVRRNEDRLSTAFTVSIEAKEGVTTGISAGDRARTINVAIDPNRGRADIVTPGHVFPLVAREGGVLIRAGHTEAAVDVSRLAGLNPSGVICEIMRDDGSMARLDDLVGFARRHNLKIGTIRDLIAYRRKHDRLVEKRAEERFTSRWGGEWNCVAFYNSATGTEQTALVKGHIDPDKPTLVRMHQLSPFGDMLGEEGERGAILERSMEMIAKEGSGVIVILNRATPTFMSRAIDMRQGRRQPQPEELRDYGAGAQILTELGVQDMVLLTNTHHSLVGLDAYGLSIVGERAIA